MEADEGVRFYWSYIIYVDYYRQHNLIRLHQICKVEQYSFTSFDPDILYMDHHGQSLAEVVLKERVRVVL
jgi:hypothetical protein